MGDPRSRRGFGCDPTVRRRSSISVRLTSRGADVREAGGSRSLFDEFFSDFFDPRSRRRGAEPDAGATCRERRPSRSFFSDVDPGNCSSGLRSRRGARVGEPRPQIATTLLFGARQDNVVRHASSRQVGAEPDADRGRQLVEDSGEG
jgi:hypothetical protein